MDQMRLKKEDKSVMFGQLFGMCDHITFTLGMCLQQANVKSNISRDGLV